MKICLLHCKKHFISWEKFFSCSWALLLKLQLATFSHWERSFWASVASHSHTLLSCTNTESVFLEALKKWFCALSSKMTFLQKSSNSWKSVSCIFKKTVYFIRKKTFFMYLSFAPKIAFSNFFSLRKVFERLWASHSHDLLMKICLLHFKKLFISLERNIFHVLELCS